MTTVVNTSTSFHLRVSKIRQAKNNIFTKENRIKPKWPTSLLKVFDKLVPRLSIDRAKMYAFLDPPKEPFLKTVEHPWTKTMLSRGGRREKKFNPTLMHKLIRIE